MDLPKNWQDIRTSLNMSPDRIEMKIIFLFFSHFWYGRLFRASESVDERGGGGGGGKHTALHFPEEEEEKGEESFLKARLTVSSGYEGNKRRLNKKGEVCLPPGGHVSKGDQHNGS